MKSTWDTDPHQDRFDPIDFKRVMKAVVTAGNGGYDKLQCRVVNLPQPERGEVLLQVLAAGGQQHRDKYPYWLVLLLGNYRYEGYGNRRGTAGNRKSRRGMERDNPFPLYPGHGLLRPYCGRWS